MNKIKNKKEVLGYTFLFFLLVAADQYSKYFISSRTAVFRNDRFAFSLNIPTSLMYLVYTVLLVILANWFFKTEVKTRFEKIAFVLILAGALSNIAERLINGAVIDFIYLFNGVLNVADFYIIAGVLILLLRKEPVHRSQ